MRTPICDFVREYASRGACRLHMPGHKGRNLVGCEALDLTEIEGADSLWSADGIIAESEKNASALFGAHTFYSTEGSSLCIRAMLYLARIYAAEKGVSPRILAGRNAHSSFITAAAALDVEVSWIESDSRSYLRCTPSAEEVDRLIDATRPIAVYLTSPDYLGNICDVQKIAQICRKKGVLLLVDNAHGAYLKFLPSSAHPIDLGAHMCADSAHKTLPSLTGAAYLHVSHSAPDVLTEMAKTALSFFASTSPSYLTLQSLDATNAYIDGGIAGRIAELAASAEKCKKRLAERGFELVGDEPLKLTLATKPYGYEGREIARILDESGFVCEFADRDFVVMMLSCELEADALEGLCDALEKIERRAPIEQSPPCPKLPTRVLSIREAALCPSERIPLDRAVGRILAAPCVSCPPAVSIVVCGERIDEDAVRAMRYFGAESCLAVKQLG